MMKRCTCCGVEKPLAAFSKQAKGKFGVTSQCKPCTVERGRRWRQANLERCKSNAKAYVERNREKVRAYSAEWRERKAEHCKKLAAVWMANNLDKKRAATAKRRATRLRAIPSWANLSDIKRFYVLASLLTKQTGIRANVDHVVPLQSQIVCGLHCAANLNIVTERLNKSKGNLHWPDMPGSPDRDPEQVVPTEDQFEDWIEEDMELQE